jgi:hypothetical protein
MPLVWYLPQHVMQLRSMSTLNVFFSTDDDKNLSAFAIPNYYTQNKRVNHAPLERGW